MLFSAFDQAQTDPLGAVISMSAFALSLVAAITFHEFSHALSATLLGDYTARRKGRLTLWPPAHLDPLGTAMIVLAGFGWGKPTPVDADRLGPGPRPGMAAVALAGPLSNIVVATVASLPFHAGLFNVGYVGLYLFSGSLADVLPYLLGALIFWNLLLAAFNIIPLAPLDGFKIALGILPRELAAQFAQLERFGPMILLGAIMIEFLIPGKGLLSAVVRPLLDTLAGLVMGGQL